MDTWNTKEISKQSNVGHFLPSYFLPFFLYMELLTIIYLHLHSFIRFLPVLLLMGTSFMRYFFLSFYGTSFHYLPSSSFLLPRPLVLSFYGYFLPSHLCSIFLSMVLPSIIFLHLPSYFYFLSFFLSFYGHLVHPFLTCVPYIRFCLTCVSAFTCVSDFLLHLPPPLCLFLSHVTSCQVIRWIHGHMEYERNHPAK